MTSSLCRLRLSLASARLAFFLSESNCLYSGPLAMFLSILFVVAESEARVFHNQPKRAKMLVSGDWPPISLKPNFIELQTASSDEVAISKPTFPPP